MSNQYCFANNKLKLYITPYTNRIFRITYGELKTDSVIVTARPENVLCDYQESDNSYIIKTKNSIACIGIF